MGNGLKGRWCGGMSDILKKKLITDTLIKAGVKISDKGFYLLRDIILMYTDSKCPVDVKQKDVFSYVGEKYGMKYSSVQKYVRIPIENAMSYSDIDFLEEYFGLCYRPDTGTVTPQSFIIRIADDVNLQCEELAEGEVSA